ncbi:MAG: SDR family oxidoreductase [Anaerolineae bacterium]|jgi:3-oxoacyl-[acyl-carrier protein] reductase|nr:SDR family oxidoreductase [Anaerolineae bacterium]
MGHLDGKIALITGASRGIGRAVALSLAQAGAHIVLTARTEADLQQLAGEITALGVQALAAVSDLTQAADVARVQQQVQDTFGQVDILVNNAGVGKYGTIDQVSVEEYDWMMNTNMRSTFLCTKAFLPAMLERRAGHVVFVGSVAGLRGLPNEAVYCASKHAQYGFATALDHEVRDRGVKVSYIAPGGVHTYFAFGTGRNPDDPKLQEFLDAEDVAEAVLFAVTQPPKGRIFLIGMRPMREAL